MALATFMRLSLMKAVVLSRIVPMLCVSSRVDVDSLSNHTQFASWNMLKWFGMTTVVLFVVGFGSASSSQVNARPRKPTRDARVQRI